VEAAVTGVMVSVANDGPPVAGGMEERIFERFVALDQGGGSGLGLAIARELARAYGGDVTYRDEQFVLTMPAVTG
jgi:signal transduction histidine kinase